MSVWWNYDSSFISVETIEYKMYVNSGETIEYEPQTANITFNDMS